MSGSSDSPTIFTIGHSTRSLEELVALLKANAVERLVDVRTIPRSRRNPQFNLESLPGALQVAGIQYTHMKGLGGLRHPRPDSSNQGWKNDSFRGFADYMQTPEFEKNLAELVRMAQEEQVAILCAEAVPWRCHRSLIGDALSARGIQVEHIIGAGKRYAHKLTAFARVEGNQVTYPAAETGESQE